MKWIVKAKHWQLFLPFPVFIVLMQVMAFSNISSPEDFISRMPFFMLGMSVSMGVFLFLHMGWFYGVLTYLRPLLPADINLPFKRIMVLLFIPIAYTLLVMVGVAVFALNISELSVEQIPMVFPIMFGVILPLNFAAMACNFHTMVYTAKLIRTVELKRETVFNDYMGEFFLCWFWYIGVWILQPRINKMFAEPKDEAMIN